MNSNKKNLLYKKKSKFEELFLQKYCLIGTKRNKKNCNATKKYERQIEITNRKQY